MTRKKHTQGKGQHGQLRGGARPPEHAIWKMMVQRCYNSNNRQYKDYGARGIRVCDRWLAADGFANFLVDLGPQPFPGAGLRRLDEGKNFEPGNVVWGPTRQKMLTFDGRSMSMAAWARELGMKPSVFCRRIRTGWAMKSILARRRRWCRRVPWNDEWISEMSGEY